MPFLNTTYLVKIRSTFLAYALKRRDVIKQSGDALHQAKRAIFALHRNNRDEAAEKLKEVERIFSELNKKYKTDPAIMSEGSYNAGMEEYVEAKLLYGFLTSGKIGQIKELPIEGNIYIAGLCDVPGELYRYAIKSATERNMAMVKTCAEAASEIIGELIEFDLTSYLRTKFDQAKQALQKLEQIVYEVSLKEKE